MTDNVTEKLPAIKEVLQGLSLLPAKEISAEEGARVALEDFSLQVTKTTQKLIGWGTGAGAGAGLVTSFLTFTQDQGQVVIAAVVFSTAVVIAAGVTALAKVMDGDVRGRSAVATASVNARGDVTEKLLETLRSQGATADSPTPKRAKNPTEQQLVYGLAFGSNFKASTDGGEFTVTGVRWTQSDELELRLHNSSGEDWVTADKVTGFVGLA
ncbi:MULTISPECIES: hypothetical protein [unclassified Kribbella]|uniref:hypothetical protein n=1 Tax=unclassified Kribbella TaxID=2644121 RepID=UPI00301A1F7D